MLIGETGDVNSQTELQEYIEQLERENRLLREEVYFSDQRLMVALKNSKTAVSQCDSKIRFEKLYNHHSDFDPQDLVGSSLSVAHYQSGMKKLNDIKHQVVNSGKGVSCEIDIKLSDGLFTYKIQVEPMKNFEGEVVGVVVAATDVTEVKDREKYISQTQKLATVGQMASGMSHEIKNQLAVITGLVQLASIKLNKLDVQESILRKLDTALVQCQKASKLATQMLEVARPKRYKVAYDIVETIEAVLDLQQTYFNLENIKVERHFSPVPKVTFDRDLFEQGFLNLTINARHAMKHYNQGIFTVRVEEIEGQIRISFEDTGIGMKEEVQKRIFDPFFTTKRTAEGNNNAKGTGLGLSIVKQTIINHGGTIEVKSVEGQGTKFIIHLPIESSNKVN